MKKSLTSFTTGLIDYAGLFPPSKLDLNTAIHNFARYKSSNDSYMLSNFIIPVSRLHELDAYEDLFKSKPPFYFSILCTAGAEISSYSESLNEQLREISRFTQKMGSNAVVTTLEIKLPAFGSDSGELIRALNDGARLISSAIPDEVSVFYEPDLRKNYKETITCLTQAIALHNQEFDAKTRYIKGGFKLRCGGVETHMFPTIDQVAAVLYACREHQIPFKATAGLHHPVRHFNDSVQTTMHGFFNVFGAAILAFTHTLSEATLKEILSDEDPKSFRFSDYYFSWKKTKVPTASIDAARKNFCVSFGSCSFDEPREDLQSAGLMAVS